MAKKSAKLLPSPYDPVAWHKLRKKMSSLPFGKGVTISSELLDEATCSNAEDPGPGAVDRGPGPELPAGAVEAQAEALYSTELGPPNKITVILEPEVMELLNKIADDLDYLAMRKDNG